jgi:hypothetical protein
VPSRVVHVRHAGVWKDSKSLDPANLDPQAIRQMLDAAIKKLTGLDDAGKAWKAMFRPSERIAIKVNTFSHSTGSCTHVQLVNAVVEQLQAAGLPPEQIVIFDRYDYDLQAIGYTINRDKPGVRCYGNERQYATGWTLVDTKVMLSQILLESDALINIPVLKQHMYGGISFAMKNHYGTFNRPDLFHGSAGQAIADLNAFPAIKDRTRLVIGDALTVTLGDYWDKEFAGDSIFMSFDPVAHDAVALQLFADVRKAKGFDPTAYIERATTWLTKSTELGLGTNDPSNMELVKVNLA